MGASVKPERQYSPDNPFAKQASGAGSYSPDNPFAKKDSGLIDLHQASPKAEPEGSGLQKAAETLVSGFPGAQRAVAGYRGLVSLLSGEGLGAAANEVENAMSQQKRDVASVPGYLRIPTQIAGSLPAAAALAPLGIVGGGAAFGAAEGADKSAASLKDRAVNTAVGAGLGAVTAKGTQLIGKGIKNVSDRTGLTDKIVSAIQNRAPNLAASMGTQGQVNKALGKREDILNALGAPGETGAKLQMDRIASTKAQAKSLYDAARADTKVIQDPELNALLSDPYIQKVYQTASELRAASGNPLQKIATPNQVPLALQKMGVSPERYAELQGLNQSRRIGISGTEVLPPELMGEQAQGIEMPDPDVLAKVKRYISQAAYGRMNSPLSINQDEARALLPKVDAIRQKLHEVSPAWKQADTFYAQAKGEEEAFQHGFDAFRVAKNPTGANLPEHSPEAMLQAIQEPRYPGEPAEALQGRADAFRQGVKAAAAGQIKGKPVERDLSSILKTQALNPSQNGIQARSLMFPQTEEQKPLESLIARLRGESNQLSSSTAGSKGYIPASQMGLVKSLVKKVTQSPDLIEGPGGQQVLMERLGNPDILKQELGRAAQGASLSDYLHRLAGISLSGQVAR